MIPEFGWGLSSRALMFWLEDGLPASLAPGKRPRTTLTPTLAYRDGAPALAFGTPGGDQQDQWTQPIVRTTDPVDPRACNAALARRDMCLNLFAPIVVSAILSTFFNRTIARCWHAEAWPFRRATPPPKTSGTTPAFEPQSSHEAIDATCPKGTGAGYRSTARS